MVKILYHFTFHLYIDAKFIYWDLCFTWNGITTRHHKTYRKKIGIDKHIEAYIQSLTLKKTLESITLDMWGNKDTQVANRDERVNDALKIVYIVDKKVIEGAVMSEV